MNKTSAFWSCALPLLSLPANRKCSKLLTQHKQVSADEWLQSNAAQLAENTKGQRFRATIST